MANLYVSSTFSDLKEFREQVRNTLRRLGHLDVAMEYDNASDERPVDKCLRDVANADLYLGIFAWRYGYVPEGYDKSITELEYRKAVEAGKECLIFILHEEAPWPRTKMERGAASEKVEALRSELCDRHTVQFFSNEDELRAVVSEALNDWAKKQGLKQNVLSTDWDAYARAVVDEHQWVRLVVIAGARQDRFAQIPLTEIFVPQMTAAGPPTYEVPDEVLKQKRDLFTVEKAAESPEEESESPVEVESQERRENLDGIDVALPELSLDVLGRERTQVFLGGPGSGKSTLLLYAMLALCDPDGLKTKSIANLTHVPIPFLIELRQYVLRQMPTFISYIVANIQERYGTTITPEDLHALLSQERRALMLFDGLDEVFNPSERQRVVQQFKAFARQYPLVQIVVTSRIVGYDKMELGVAEFQHYTLLDFNLPQIREFVPCWYRYYTWQGDQRDAQGLIRRITESRRLMELAGNPLLLTMMGVIYKHQDLPEQRWKLYERCTEVLLEDWDIKSKSIDLKTFLPLDIQIRTSQKVEILQRVSLYMLENHQPGRELNAIAQQPLMRILAEYLKERYNKSAGDAGATAKGILNHLRERTYILAEVGEGIFGFVHRTFMEYFAAGACLADFNSRKADYTWLTQKLYGMHWQQDAWQEVLLLLTAMLADQGSPIVEVIECLCHDEQEPPHNMAFAARCLAESGEIFNQKQAQSLIANLVRKIAAYAKYTKGAAFVEVGLAAFSMLAPLIEVSEEAKKIIDDLNSDKILRKRMAGWQMGFALRSHAERLAFAITALGDAEEAVRRGAIAALEREWPERE